MKITNPELKVVRFASEDVIATSNFSVSNGDGTYKVYSGAMQYYDENQQGWYVAFDGDYFATVTAAQLDNNKSLYNPLYEIYNDYYTKGASYYELNPDVGYQEEQFNDD